MWFKAKPFAIQPGLIAVTLAASLAAWPLAAAELPELATLRAWVQEMKSAARGPFETVRWYCKDGTILPPKPYACQPHGGGIQHGVWTARVRQMRAGGLYVANILAGLDGEAFLAEPDHRARLGQILIEQFLITVDDGWILRRARFYRGALQEEDEREGARELLLALLQQPDWLERDYLALRAAARLLRHGAETGGVTKVRQESAALSERDAGFKPLRNKIHVSPDPSDAAAVRAYAAKLGSDAARTPYLALAAAIDAVYSSQAAEAQLQALAGKAAKLGALGPLVTAGAASLARARDPRARLETTAKLLAALRDGLAEPASPALRLAVLDASLALEGEHFAAATRLRDGTAGLTRRQRLGRLATSADAVYGAGLVSPRQRAALTEALAALDGPQAGLDAYKDMLDYLALVPGWGSQWLHFQFQGAMEKMATIEPLAELFIQDQLRGSPLFLYVDLLDGLLRDANRLAGVRNELFGKDVGSGLRSLNPGLARGVLHTGSAEHQAFRADGVYLLPETIAELPPVAGILTAGEGNPLSHVQLLARNLGIPNVAVDQALIPGLGPWDGKIVILAVSPAGSVQLSEDRGQGEALFGDKAEQAESGVLIRPDLEKLDLEVSELLPLSRLRADDSGRTVGPKAAKLGELKHRFPEAVAEGLAIPFGVFRELLDQPYGASGQSVRHWMVASYRALERMPAGSAEREAATEAFRQKLYDWIVTADPGRAFKERLKVAMAEVFGTDGSYGVFVRSDTNVEDLPGFTGAGLNLTVPNVVGAERIIEAIPRVWASPFTARAFAWRQSHMDQPEHVYPAVLLLASVPAEKSGVLVTQDIDSGRGGWLSVAVNEGVGGAVDGQAAESLRIETATGRVKLLAQATAPIRRRVNPKGGIDKIPVSDAEAVLRPDEIAQLIALAEVLPQRFPSIVDADGKPAPADIEFGFLDGRLRLFQIRPFLESARARGSAYLKSLDGDLKQLDQVSVDLSQRPTGGNP